MKRITIKVNSKTFYRSFLDVLKVRAPISQLRPKELDVLAELMFYNAQMKDLSEDDKYDILFSTRMRKEMRESIGISEDSFNNNLSILRKCGLITKGNKLNKSLETVKFDGKFILEFYFTE